MRSMQPYFDIVLIVEGHVCQYRDYAAEHVRVILVEVYLQKVQNDVDEVQVSKFHQNVEIVCSTSHCCQGLETTEDALPHLICLSDCQLTIY